MKTRTLLFFLPSDFIGFDQHYKMLCSILIIRFIVSHICVPKKKDIAVLNEYDTKRLVH